MDEVKSALSSDPECGPNVALFYFGEKCEKHLHQAHPELHEHQLGSAKKGMNSVLGEILEGLHEKWEIQRSAPLRNAFLRNMQGC